jgi:hypothetical protein
MELTSLNKPYVHLTAGHEVEFYWYYLIDTIDFWTKGQDLISIPSTPFHVVFHCTPYSQKKGYKNAG